MTIRIFPNSAGWNVERSDPRPQPRSVDREPDPGDDRQQQEDQAEEADRVRVGVELTVVADEQQREHEGGEPDQSSQSACSSAMSRGQEPVDHREAESSEHPGDREQHGIRAGCRPSHDAPCQEVGTREREPVDDDVAPGPVRGARVRPSRRRRPTPRAPPAAAAARSAAAPGVRRRRSWTAPGTLPCLSLRLPGRTEVLLDLLDAG